MKTTMTADKELCRFFEDCGTAGIHECEHSGHYARHNDLCDNYLNLQLLEDEAHE